MCVCVCVFEKQFSLKKNALRMSILIRCWLCVNGCDAECVECPEGFCEAGNKCASGRPENEYGIRFATFDESSRSS